MKPALVMSIVCVLTVTVGTGQRQATTQPARSAPGSRVHKVEELTWRQIDALNRQRTLFILPVGMLEQHGPHLPVGADTIGIMYEANRVSTRVSQALPDWNVVMMPAVNYGHGGANLLGDRSIHPGTYAIRQSTLRSLVADLGARIAENGFKWIFVMNGHGAPTHNIALNEASDFISETYAVTMLHVTGLFQADAAIQSRGEKINARNFSAADLSSFGMDIHAGVNETSGILAIRPDLVRPDYKSLPSQSGRSLDELRTIARAPAWQGYFSSPARATAAHGRAIEGWWIDGATDLILRAVGGENMFVHPRLPDAVPAAVAPTIEQQLASEAAFDGRLENWLAQRRKR
jgi:creatinine amidohydrolase